LTGDIEIHPLGATLTRILRMNVEAAKTDQPAVAAKSGGIRFDRNEVAGAFGDIGTDLPLIIGMIAVGGLDAASVLIMYGVMQVGTGLYYRLPMPVQPLKAVAILVMTTAATGKITSGVIYGGGLAIGITMLVLTATRLMDLIGRIVPKVVVRGIQLGLGLQLSSLALKEYVPKDGAPGYWLAGLAFVVALALYGNRKYPAALFIIIGGAIYACIWKLNWSEAGRSIGLQLPKFQAPALADVKQGFLLLALVQVPLSIGNSILAAAQTSKDLFPDRAPSMRKISFTYSAMNLINPFFGGIPTCHGSGGLAGYYAFGGRTGGAVIIYGSIYLVLGLFFSSGFQNVIQVFPYPILGVILLFEGISMMLLVRDMAAAKFDFFVVAAVGALAFGIPNGYGYLVGLIVGTLMAYALPKLHTGFTAKG
jgi:hypothetical protein